MNQVLIFTINLQRNITTSLSLGHNVLCAVSYSAATQLASALKRCSSLQRLTLHLRYIGSDALRILLSSCSSAPALTAIHIVGGLTQQQARLIANSVSHLSIHVTSITFSPVNLDHGSIALLVEALERNKYITEFEVLQKSLVIHHNPVLLRWRPRILIAVLKNKQRAANRSSFRFGEAERRGGFGGLVTPPSEVPPRMAPPPQQQPGGEYAKDDNSFQSPSALDLCSLTTDASLTPRQHLHQAPPYPPARFLSPKSLAPQRALSAVMPNSNGVITGALFGKITKQGSMVDASPPDVLPHRKLLIPSPPLTTHHHNSSPSSHHFQQLTAFHKQQPSPPVRSSTNHVRYVRQAQQQVDIIMQQVDTLKKLVEMDQQRSQAFAQHVQCALGSITDALSIIDLPPACAG